MTLHEHMHNVGCGLREFDHHWLCLHVGTEFGSRSMNCVLRHGCDTAWLWWALCDTAAGFRHQSCLCSTLEQNTYIYRLRCTLHMNVSVCMHTHTGAHTHKNTQFPLCMTLYAYVHKQTQSHIRHHHLCLQRRIRSQHPLRRIYIYVCMCMCIEVHLLFSSDKK